MEVFCARDVDHLLFYTLKKKKICFLSIVKPYEMKTNSEILVPEGYLFMTHLLCSAHPFLSIYSIFYEYSDMILSLTSVVDPTK